MLKPAHFAVIKRVFAVWVVALSACSTPSTPPGTDITVIDLTATRLPAIAAEFVTTRTGDDHSVLPEPVVWRLWRNSQQIITERPQLAIGELWQRDGQTIIHRKLYFADQRAIEFQEDDLKMLQLASSWQKLSLVLDPGLLQQLTASEIEWTEGYPLRDYQGKLQGNDWHVVMRMDLALPSLIERRQGEFFERTELLKAYPLSQSPWQPSSADSVEIIDYADLGDKETDPFVIKVQAQMGHDH
ncbi:MAG: hypothetical protein CTY19_07310 [Methylomonas sp.]|nr:MAG: hypothetical protein CTY19_07310 [Methylomonas sp.]